MPANSVSWTASLRWEETLAAMHLVSLAAKSNLQLTVADIFRNPSLQDMAKAMGGLSNSSLPNISLPNPTAATITTAYQQSMEQIHHSLESLWLPSNQISSVYPITSKQREFIERDLQSSGMHWSWSYFYINLPTTCNIEHIVACCSKLVSNFEILRTVFSRSSAGIVQVFLHTMKPDVRVVNRPCSTMEELFQESIDQDLDAEWELGQPALRFIVLHAAGGTTRLVIRISHALYDGISMPSLIRTFDALFRGDAPPSEVGFSRYLRHVMDRNEAAQAYWLQLLKGAAVTRMPCMTTTEADATLDTGAPIHMTRNIPSILTRGNNTPAMAFTAACGIALGHVSDSDDVVFGRLVSGRYGLLGELQEAAGPCLRDVPVRVQVNSATQGIGGIIGAVHNQYVNGLEYETVSTEQVLWDFALVSQYQNIDVDVGEDGQFQVYKRTDLPIGSPKISVFAVPNGDETEVGIWASPMYHERGVIERLFSKLLGVLEEYHDEAEEEETFY